MITILSIVLGVLVLGILVFVHELGHFLAAKWCGINVITFSLGFGSPLISKTWKGTEYRISAIPFGGYVKMAGENPEEQREGAPDEFSSKPIWQRAVVAIAGPASNYIIALLMLWFVFMWGVERPLYYQHPIVGAVADSSAARQAGLMAGDSLVSVNGKNIKTWEDIETAFAQQERTYSFVFIRDNQRNTAEMILERKGPAIPEDPTGGVLPPLPAVIADVNKDSPAQKAGLKPGDTVISIDGQKVYSWFQLMEIVEKWTPGSPLQFTVARDGTVLSADISPEFDKQAGRKLVGIRVSEGEKEKISYSPLVAVRKGLDKGWEYTTMIFDVIGKLVSRQVPASQLAGPVGIIPASGFMVMQGLSPILNFMALIGINLAVLNLMPLIITDGGLLLFLGLEAIRRKPLNIKTQMTINKIAIAFFLLLFLFVTFNDVMRLPQYIKIFGN